jgi:phage terminase large subunit
VLNEERFVYRRSDPGAYDHVWEGGYATAVSGSYFGDLLTQARRDGRITELHIDPLLEVRAFFDIGVADVTSIWLSAVLGLGSSCDRLHRRRIAATGLLRE